METPVRAMPVESVLRGALGVGRVGGERPPPREEEGDGRSVRGEGVGYGTVMVRLAT
ncbi:hypothetical protein Aph02nite_11970 [Actinoplanes philippinensis]|nr:hypothetical protein Aph02nite_11970 [Actinoplanes philippinensis]